MVPLMDEEVTIAWPRLRKNISNPEIPRLAKEHNLLNEWEIPRIKLKKPAANSKTLLRVVKKTKLKSFNSTPVYIYGYNVPRNHQEAMKLDRNNGNNKWAKSEKLETSQLLGNKVYTRILVTQVDCYSPEVPQEDNLHFIYAVKVPICNPFILS